MDINVFWLECSASFGPSQAVLGLIEPTTFVEVLRFQNCGEIKIEKSTAVRIGCSSLQNPVNKMELQNNVNFH